MVLSLITRKRKPTLPPTPSIPPLMVRQLPAGQRLGNVSNTESDVQSHPKSPKLQSSDARCETPPPLYLTKSVSRRPNNEKRTITPPLHRISTEDDSPISPVACQCSIHSSRQNFGPNGVDDGHTQEQWPKRSQAEDRQS